MEIEKENYELCEHNQIRCKCPLCKDDKVDIRDKKLDFLIRLDKTIKDETERTK